MRLPSNTLLPLVVRALLVPGGFALALMASTTQASTLSGNLALTSDYVWRGISQTQGDPAVQAGLKLSGDRGFYGAVWASNVEFAPELKASSEFDFTVGWAGTLSDEAALDVSLVHYRFPSTTVDLNWTEANAVLTLHQNWWVALGYSTEALGLDESGLYAQLGARWPVSDAFRLEAAIGQYDVDNALGPDTYAHGQLSAIWAVRAPLEIRATVHATNDSGERLYGDALAGDRVEVALQYAF